MSKEAAMRAMREARYNTTTARSTTAAKRPRPTGPPTQTQTQAVDPAAASSPTDVPCGHRSMNGRTCTREQGHAAKSHRYS